MLDVRAILRMFFVVAGLVATPFAAQAVVVIQGPTLTMNPGGQTPLAGVVDMETDVAVQVRLTITDGTDLWSVEFGDAAQVHALPVLGLKPGRSYTVDVELIPGGLVGSLPAVTAPLPADFPVLLTVASDPARMEPGLTVVDCFSRASGDSRPRYLMIVDNAGEVVWYSTLCASAVVQLPNGNLFYRSTTRAIEIDMLGSVKLDVTLADPGLGLHHDLVRSIHGTYLSLSRKSVDVPDYPTSYTDPNAPTATTTVRDEPFVEFLPDGSLRNEFLFTEMTDPTRIGYLSLNSTSAGADWVHDNAVIYDPSDDTMIVSMRHQDALVKFSRETGDLVWILGPHDNWTPEFQPFLLHPIGTPFRWQYHQHAPIFTDDGTLVLFDNGNNRTSPLDGNTPIPDSANFSRGVEYEIDEQAMQIRQVWEYGENIPSQLMAPARGDADWLPATGNVLMTFSGVNYVGGASSASLGLGATHSRVVEATDDTVPEAVFELALYDADGGRINVYRSEKIPNLYPMQGGLVRYVKPPNGVGDTLRAGRTAGTIPLDWDAAAVDAQHDAADYYVVYVSDAPDSGFSMLDSTANSQATPSDDSTSKYYKIVAANSGGTSGDEPAP